MNYDHKTIGLGRLSPILRRACRFKICFRKLAPVSTVNAMPQERKVFSGDIFMITKQRGERI